ncbi:ice-binding family protein [Maribacter sp. ACAM166]|uniref:ice-binding family protein n=1 Tax=Maribacter sp. ACAM166 TaxID=2508996 RepID=UPI0010FE3B23|nr:ice-binding family protein [Maribacter sp. ACAM166]TLP80293.1 DUF3494 domain-containing protein [Maribacter sp. ACAM166]
MKKFKSPLFFLIILISVGVSAQTGIGTNNPDESSILEIRSTSKGFLMPRLSTIERDLIFRPAKGLMIFNTTANTVENNVGTKDEPIWASDKGEKGARGSRGPKGAHGDDGKSAYDIWLTLGNYGSEDEFFAALNDGAQGPQGLPGANGADGLSALEIWEIANPNANPDDFTNGAKGDTGEQGPQGLPGVQGATGADGKSAFEIWLETNTGGTPDDFANGLDGANGEDGAPGINGADGQDGVDGTDGADGKSAFEIWLETNTGGTQDQFTNGLDGADGEDGAPGVNGADGQDGADGKSAFEIWLETNTGGTQDQFTNGLDGADGEDGAPGVNGADGQDGVDGTNGADGKSAFEIWLETNTGGTPDDFANGLDGANGEDGAPGINGADGQDGVDGTDGADGKSAFEIWLETNTGGTQDQFTNGLDGADGEDGAPGVNGADGQDGVNGAQGEDGAQGQTGAQGEAGVNGENGKNGNNGYDGEEGAKGDTGATGANGATGNDGADGTNGSNGSIGTTGDTGASAYEIWGSEANGVNVGDKAEFIASLKGEIGETGEVGPQGIEGESPSSNSIDDSGSISTSSSSAVEINGMSKAPIAGNYLVFFNSEYSIEPAYEVATVTTKDALTDLQKLFKDIDAMKGSHTGAATNIGGKTITPGTYSYGGALSIGTDVTLDGAGVYVFKTGGAFNTTAGVTVELINGASAENIFWVSTGAIGLGAGTIIHGNLLSKIAVAVGAGCTVDGRMLSLGGAIAISGGEISVPEAISEISMGAVHSFVMLTKAGAIANTGGAVEGQVSTKAGAISGFTDANHTGEIVPAGGNVEVIKELDGNATFSLYNHGELIPNSTRTRTTKVNTVDVTLQAMATIAEGERIEARWSIDAGTLSVDNRVLTLIKVNPTPELPMEVPVEEPVVTNQ